MKGTAPPAPTLDELGAAVTEASHAVVEQEEAIAAVLRSSQSMFHSDNPLSRYDRFHKTLRLLNEAQRGYAKAIDQYRRIYEKYAKAYMASLEEPTAILRKMW